MGSPGLPVRVQEASFCPPGALRVAIRSRYFVPLRQSLVASVASCFVARFWPKPDSRVSPTLGRGRLFPRPPLVRQEGRDWPVNTGRGVRLGFWCKPTGAYTTDAHGAASSVHYPIPLGVHCGRRRECRLRAQDVFCETLQIPAIGARPDGMSLGTSLATGLSYARLMGYW